MRILFTSSDPGSAQQNNSIAKYIKKRKNSLIGYISSQVAEEYYQVNFDESLSFKKNEIISKRVIQNRIVKFNPDFIILGLSENNNNIDYIACQIARKLKIESGSIQDYYGYIGSFDQKVKPNHFFVIDDYAKRLTKKKILKDCNVLITGSPKHYEYFNKIDDFLNNYKKINIRDSRIIFFSQPISISGIKNNLEIFCKSINHIDSTIKINIKPHPLDISNDYYVKLSRNYNINIINNDYSVELLLLYFDHIFTCFSTVAYDYYFLFSNFIHCNYNKLYNLLIGTEIYKSIDKVNFNIKYTKQYEFGTNIKSSDYLKVILSNLINSSSVEKLPLVDPMCIRLSQEIKYNISAYRIINFIENLIKEK